MLRAEAGDLLPGALVHVLRQHGIEAGWLRGSGVLADIELVTHGAESGMHGATRRVAGPARALVLDGTIGTADGEVVLGLRVVFIRETGWGMETLAGELLAARVVALEAVVTALDDAVMPRGLDPDAGIWLLTEPSRRGEGVLSPALDETMPARPTSQAQQGESPPWADAIAASAAPAKEKPAAGGLGQPIPVRPARPATVEEDRPFPSAGDTVEHFAFGTCEVVKSDGDRLHLRVGKDGRVKEIALEMLRVTSLGTEGDMHRYRLDRRM